MEFEWDCFFCGYEPSNLRGTAVTSGQLRETAKNEEEGFANCSMAPFSLNNQEVNFARLLRGARSQNGERGGGERYSRNVVRTIERLCSCGGVGRFTTTRVIQH